MYYCGSIPLNRAASTRCRHSTNTERRTDHEHEAHEDLLELDVRVSQEVSAGWAQIDVAASNTNRRDRLTFRHSMSFSAGGSVRELAQTRAAAADSIPNVARGLTVQR